MAILLYKLHGVPEIEALEIRRILEEAEIDYYETTAGNWGISLAAIWLAQDSDEDKAKLLLEDFQNNWRQQVLTEQQAAPKETLAQRLMREPIKVVLALIAVAGILYLSIIPFTGAWS